MEFCRIEGKDWRCNRCKGVIALISDIDSTRLYLSEKCERRRECAEESMLHFTETEGEC